ncbi:MAG TPA: N-acetylglucosamine-6-phosphate deacetylase [Chloroflexi bacterium]|nr:N-acetylglucosamine-6-phosphate deacetylase [Chloroflexota bacterium]
MSRCDRFAIVNGRLALPDRIVEGQALIIAAGKIAGVAPLAAFDPTLPRFDAGGRLVTPGLIDIHIHGALGHTFNEPTPAAFAAITRLLAQHGVTSLLATTATDTLENLTAVLAFARTWMQTPTDGQHAQLLGVHVEGPYFHPAQAGAQNPAYLRTPDDGSAAQLLAQANVIRIFTFAPELPGALALTRTLRQHGIVAAAGHSTAQEKHVLPCIEAGLSHCIHLWSAQSTTVREGPWRRPGLLEVSLTDERLTGEIIADGKHLPPTLLKLAYRCLGPDRLCVVSDATSGAGLPEGSRFFMAGAEYEVADGVGMMLDRTSFAGSTTLLDRMLAVLVETVGVPLVEAVRMATLTPARVAGVADRKGSLEAGKDADLAIFDPGFQPWRTLIGGRWVDGDAS